jgi:hypothetical protein
MFTHLTTGDNVELFYIFPGFVWYLTGILSFIYWWRQDYDLQVRQLFLSLFIGITGPIAFVLGWFIHGEKGDSAIVLKGFERR